MFSDPSSPVPLCAPYSRPFIKRTHRRRLPLMIITGALALNLGACASYDPEAVQQSGWYGKGYNDGCASAVEADKSFSAKQTKDEDLFDRDEGYRSGWRQGYMQCRKNDPLDDSQALGRSDEF